MLALDDPRWHELNHAYGPAGNIPDFLRALESGANEYLWQQLFAALCHEGSVYTASYAAVPHLVRIGAGAPPSDQLGFWSLVGAIAVSRDRPAIPDQLRRAYEASLILAEELTVACIGPGLHEATGLELLIALAGIRHMPAIEDALQCLREEEIDFPCPRCDSLVRISTADVPFVVEEDEMPLALGTSGEMSVPRAPHPELRSLAKLARSAGLVDLEHRIDALAQGATCPTCRLEFSLVGGNT